MEKKIEQEQATARKNAKTNKRAALNALKRKKRQLFDIKSFDKFALLWGEAQKKKPKVTLR